MHFYLDECVPASNLQTLRDRGHEASLITDFIPPGSPDQLVATVTQKNGAVLISHDKDFKLFASRRIDGQSTRYRTLNVVRMECKQPRIADRLGSNLTVIENEFNERQGMHDTRLIINIKSDVLTIHR